MIYCYCITDKAEEMPKLSGIEAEKLFFIPYKDIYALVSKCSTENYDANEENIHIHNEILQKLMKTNTIVPMAFNMVFKDEEIVKQMLRKTYGLMKASLNLFQNKVELGVKVISTPLLSGSEKDKIAADIFSTLGAKAVQFKKNKLFSEKLVVNAAFLVEKDKISNFSDAVELLEKNDKIKMNYTGPWPPYNFIEIQVK